MWHPVWRENGFVSYQYAWRFESSRVLCYWPVCPGIKHPSGPYDQIFILADSSGFSDVGRSFWQEDGSVVFKWCWSSPEQSFSGPSPVGLVTIFYCLRFKTYPTWRARSSYLYPPGTGRPSVPQTLGLTFGSSSFRLTYNSSARTTVENTFPIVSLLLRVDSLLWRRICLRALPSNGSSVFFLVVVS
jgi:hypothetical protein